MDTMQTARMIEWLDEERRRDKATIARLEQQNTQQTEIIDQMRNQISGLEGEIASMRSQFLPANRDQELMQKFREEFDNIVENLEAKRLTAEREMERRAEISRENIMQPIRQLEEQQEKFSSAIQDVMGARAERDRHTAAIAAIQQRLEDLGKKIEDPERRLTLLEEQRRQDTRRLSEVQTTLPEFSKQIENLSTKADLIEGLTKSNEKRIIDLQSGETDRREHMQEFIDQQNLISQQREIQINQISEKMNNYDEEMRRNMERFEAWAETHRQMKKVVEDFERIGERLERRINEVAEMQRLSEERFRTEWNDWIDDDQMRWKEFTVSNDESWRRHNKEFQELRSQVKELNDSLKPLRRSMERLWNFQRAQADLYRDRYQSLLLEYDKPDENLPGASSSSNNGNNTEG